MNWLIGTALVWLGLTPPAQGPASSARSAAAGAPGTLTVYAAASLTDAFRELGRALEASHPGLTVQFNFAGSQQLAVQLEQGAPADVFASADQRWMSYAAETGLVEGEGTVFARNEIFAHVWREGHDENSAAIVVEHVRRLRRAVESDPRHPRLIQTVQRRGYRFNLGALAAS